MYSVIRDTEENSGLSPVLPMDGVALLTADVGGGDGNVDNDDDNIRNNVRETSKEDGDVGASTTGWLHHQHECQPREFVAH